MTGGLGFTKMGQSLQKTNCDFLNRTQNVKGKKDEINYLETSTKFSFKKSSKKGLEKIREEAEKQRKAELKSEIILVVAVATVIGLVILLMNVL